jgi:hypothetical protein
MVYNVGMPVEEIPNTDGLEAIPRIELVSLYVNRYLSLDESRKRAFQVEFARRGLPLPDMSARPSPRAREEKRASRKEPLDSRTLLSYILLIYTLTGVVYSWIFLAGRLVRKDFCPDPKHSMILTLISCAYIAIEAVVFMLVGGD